MLHLKPGDIRVPQRRGEEVKIGELYDDSLFLSSITLIKEPSGEFRMETRFAGWPINYGHPEKPVDEETVRQERDAFVNFHLRYHQFSAYPQTV